MTSILRTSRLPVALTSYDLLKAFAIILMVVDHIGHFFFPEEMWWRVFGRMCVPIWFFLIGYAKTKGFSLYYTAGGFMLMFVVWALGGGILPLNILLALMFYRAIREDFMARVFYNYRAFFAISLIIVLISYPSMYVLEYGTITLFFVMVGYLQRHADKIDIHPPVLYGFTLFAGVSFTFLQAILLPTLSLVQFIVMLVGVCGVTFLCFNFKSLTFNALKGQVYKPIQFMGRRTMEIYALHFILFYVIQNIFIKGELSLFGFVLYKSAEIPAIF